MIHDLLFLLKDKTRGVRKALNAENLKSVFGFPHAKSKWLELEVHFFRTTEMCLGEEFKDHGTRENGRGIILIPADAQHTQLASRN